MIAGTGGLITLGSFGKVSSDWKEEEAVMPVMFVGHGSPMNAIEDNLFSRNWAELGQKLPMPRAVLCVSAHWLTRGTYVTAMEQPKTIHDFGGFPQSLFDVQYPAPGSPQMAAETVALIKKTQVGLDHDWGLDHGTWSVVKNMYPDASVPVFQLSIDFSKPLSFHYELAAELSELRKKGVLIIGSGNMVHNLGMVAWDKLGEDNYGYDWAAEINEKFKELIQKKDHKALIEYEKLGSAAKLAIPSTDHYIPLLYSLALQSDEDDVAFFNDRLVAGSLTMTSVMLGRELSSFKMPEESPKNRTERDSL